MKSLPDPTRPDALAGGVCHAEGRGGTLRSEDGPAEEDSAGGADGINAQSRRDHHYYFGPPQQVQPGGGAFRCRGV